MINSAKPLLMEWIAPASHPGGAEWLQANSQSLSENNFFGVFSAVIKKVGKGPLSLKESDFAKAQEVVEGWIPREFTLDEAARIYVLLSIPATDPRLFGTLLDEALSTADAREGIAIHKSLCLLPHPKIHYARAREGLRSNNKSYYEAVAHNNPYPFKYFEEDAWNQMVLKGLFVESHLWKIVGLEERANPTLKGMLIEYALERWAADRLVFPELWRCVAPLAKPEELPLLERALQGKKYLERLGGALGLYHCPLPEARYLLGKNPEFLNRIESGNLSWENVHEQSE